MARECYWLARSGGLAKQGADDISASAGTGGILKPLTLPEPGHAAKAHAEEYVSRWVGSVCRR
jgi:hypothetical protein